ncbi:MAG: ThuA domain-containing protein, partial [Planctomycetes bacterium]|nr:ThuA domain-containing protein [Planctomycetota bacterium]
MRLTALVTLAALLLALAPAAAAAPAPGIPEHQAKQIRDAAPAKPAAPPKKARRVLVFDTPAHLMDKDPHKGYCIPYGTCAFKTLGEKSGAYEPVWSDDVASFLPETLKTFDAVVLNNTSGAWITPTDDALPRLKAAGDTKEAVEQALRRSLLDFVSGGGGLVVIHYAIAGNPQWPAFQDLVGGKFTGHPWNEEIGVRVEEPDHPLVAAFGGKDFRLADEIYEYGPPYDRAKVRVLLSLDPGRTNMGVKWISRKDNDFALAWVRPHGKGRVFNTSFGHRTELFWNPQVLRFYLDAVQFA